MSLVLGHTEVQYAQVIASFPEEWQAACPALPLEALVIYNMYGERRNSAPSSTTHWGYTMRTDLTAANDLGGGGADGAESPRQVQDKKLSDGTRHSRVNG